MPKQIKFTKGRTLEELHRDAKLSLKFARKQKDDYTYSLNKNNLIGYAEDIIKLCSLAKKGLT